MKRLKLLWKMIKFGDKWDNVCDQCEWFDKMTDDSRYEWGYCEYFDEDIKCDCDFEEIGRFRGQRRWVLERVRATRCADCKACENSLWGKIKYVFQGGIQ